MRAEKPKITNTLQLHVNDFTKHNNNNNKKSSEKTKRSELAIACDFFFRMFISMVYKKSVISKLRSKLFCTIFKFNELLICLIK